MLVEHRYFRRRWDETRGDDHESWGPAVYYFETDAELLAVRQVEEYDNGNRLLYDEKHPEDEHGQLTHSRVFPSEKDEGAYEITATEFENVWSRGPRA